MKAAWDATTGDLDAGSEVTVDGEMAGRDIDPNAFWAKVVRHDASGAYIVQKADGSVVSGVARARLRHRKLYTKAFFGVTDDSKHDSHAMRHFSGREFQALVDDGTVAREGIVRVVTHTDNAAQHFKSTKSIQWYSTLLGQFDWLNSVVWCFGAPGHGKGVWDGLFGTLKRWFRDRQLSSLALPDEIMTDSGELSVAFDAFQQWKGHFDTDERASCVVFYASRGE